MALHDLAPFVARWRRAWGGPAEAGQEGFDVVDQRLRGSRGLTRITRRPASRSSRATRPARRSRAAQAAFALRRIAGRCRIRGGLIRCPRAAARADMALGRQGERQADLMLSWAELPRSPGHAFDDRLQAVLVGAGFDGFAEKECAPYHASRRGRPSIPPGRYFRMRLVGYFEGIDSERGLEWRCADSLSLREFLRLGTTEPVPDHSWLSKTRARL